MPLTPLESIAPTFIISYFYSQSENRYFWLLRTYCQGYYIEDAKFSNILKLIQFKADITAHIKSVENKQRTARLKADINQVWDRATSGRT